MQTCFRYLVSAARPTDTPPPEHCAWRERKLFHITLLLGLALVTAGLHAAESKVAAPGGGLTVIVSDNECLNYRVEANGRAIVTHSPLGLEFKDGTKLGPSAMIRKAVKTKHSGSWENHFGNRRFVPDNCSPELDVNLVQWITIDTFSKAPLQFEINAMFCIVPRPFIW